MNINASSDCVLSADGYEAFTVGGGVVKLHDLLLARVVPLAERVPAGTVTVYEVAIGNRSSGSKNNVLVPTQRHLPAGCGESFMGTFAAASSCELTAIIG